MVTVDSNSATAARTSASILCAAGQPATVFYLLKDADHPRALNQLTLDPLSGQVQRHERYADKPLGAQLLASVYALHVGEYFGLVGRILMALASLSMPLFFVTGWLLYLDRRRKKRQIRVARNGMTTPASGENSWLVGFASQSGFAEQLCVGQEGGPGAFIACHGAKQGVGVTEDVFGRRLQRDIAAMREGVEIASARPGIVEHDQAAGVMRGSAGAPG